RINVVLPVPASPVRTSKPRRDSIPNISSARAVSYAAPENKNLGSGDTWNGFSFSPKDRNICWKIVDVPVAVTEHLKSRAWRMHCIREDSAGQSEHDCMARIGTTGTTVLPRY